jgi:molybdopterin molybdotransferase
MALLPITDALSRILGDARPLPAESVDIDAALGRVLAETLKARRDQPPFEASAMDGYAVQATDVTMAPAKLKLIGTSAAGHGFRGAVKPGQTVRIFTGAALPRGTDTVVIQENVAADGDVITIREPAKLAQNVRHRGFDFSRGEVLIAPGTLLNTRDLGLAAAMNCATLRVRRTPRVAILSTGDELVAPGGKPGPDQIVSSNATALAAFATRFGGEAVPLGIVKDDLRATAKAVGKARDADILLTTGGASVGDHDFVQQALKDAGVTIDFWKIAMRPGKPMMYGRRGRQQVIGLPGNPVSALVCARLFLKPLLTKLLGLPVTTETVQARLTEALPANDLRQDHLRATLHIASDGTRSVTPFKKQDSSQLRTFREADALIIRPANAPEAAVGTTVPILILDF